MPEPLVLDPAEQRVLGALLEKQVTVPASYPLSLNALRTACNQATSREPVTDYTDDELNAVTLRLQRRGLVRLVHVSGGRGVKFDQRLSEILELDAPARALVTVLLLRGPQAPGELKTRTDRLHPFADRAEVESLLGELAAAETPLVRELERIAGQHDNRWIHLLGPVDVPDAPAPARDVLADGATARDARVADAYALVADDYAETLGDELAALDFDRWFLERFARLVGDGPVADAGSGPGHITAHLRSLGVRALGFDASEAMLERARADHPGIRFEAADLRRLPRPDGGWAGVLARYSLVYLAPSELADAVAALAGTLRPGGWLAVVLHVGSGVEHWAEWWGHSVDLDVVAHDQQAVLRAVASAGLADVEWYLRSPAADEHPRDKLFVLARRPGVGS